MSLAVQPDGIVKSDSAALCMSVYHRVWKPVRLILTEGRVVCQQALRVIWSVPLCAVSGVEVVETKVIFGLRRKGLLIDTGKVKRLICVKKPEEWKILILQSRRDLMLQTEAEIEGSNS